MPDIQIAGAIFRDVPQIDIPKDGGGSASFVYEDGTKEITENGTFNVSGFLNALVNVQGGGGGAEMESGIWTPTEDTQQGVIPLENAHSTWPSVYAVWINNGEWATQTLTSIGFVFLDFHQLLGTNVHTSSEKLACGLCESFAIGSNLSGTIGASRVYPSLYGKGQNVDFLGFFASESELTPCNLSSSKRYYRAGTNYKWIAVWKP